MSSKSPKTTPPAAYPGRWYGKSCYYGLHHDLHVLMEETDIGSKCDAKELARQLKKMGPALIQTDTKGHEGVNSWKTRCPEGQYPPKLKKDMLKEWRKAADLLGVPLHCHHSGLVDEGAVARHPEWTPLTLKGDKIEPDGWTTCPRSDYAKSKLIPQIKEMIDRYKVDGIWLDGELWGVHVCYCDKCKAAFKEQTGIDTPPTDLKDPLWSTWRNFHRESFEQYVSNYVEEIHAHAPHVKLCSNWLYSLRQPGEPKIKTDWLSGDNHPVFGLDNSRVETRFLSTRGRVWEMALWNFYLSMGGASAAGTNAAPGGPWIAKRPQMLMQEAANTIALGGNIMIYEQVKCLRDGRMVPWRLEQLGQVGKFVKARRKVCQGSQTLPCVAVLHSEAHLYSQNSWDCYGGWDVDAIKGATFGLLENSLSVDVMDEWCLLPQVDRFALVVAPEQDNMSEQAVNELKAYVQSGGRLLVTGPKAYERFGSDFLGVKGTQIHRDKGNNTREALEKQVYHVAAAEGAVPVCNVDWRLVKPTTAREIGRLGLTPLVDSDLSPWSSATVNKVGKGAVAYIPCDYFHYFQLDRYPIARAFIGRVVEALKPALPLKVKAPTAVDVVARSKPGQTIVHFINRLTGIPSTMRNGDVDEIPFVGPIRVTMPCPKRPAKVTRAFEKGELTWKFKKCAKGGGTLEIEMPLMHIHEAIVVEA